MSVNRILLTVGLVLGVTFVCRPAFALTAQEQANQQLVLAQMQAMAEKNVAKASSYLAPGYIQHNPNVPTGKAGFVGFFNRVWAGKPPGTFTPPDQVVVEGDLVMVMMKRPKPEPADASKSYDSYWFDLYRVADGKIAEHWDGATKPAK